MSAIVDVQARIGEIQGFMTALRAQATNSSTATSTTTTTSAAKAAASSGTTTFADALAASMSLDPAATSSTSATGTGTTGTSGTAGTTTGQGLVDAAMAYVGVPYVWGGEDPATGLDCSGLVQRSMADLGVDSPRVARDQAKLGTAVSSIAAALPGDLLIFDGGSHIAIYVGDGRMIDAPKPGKSVSVRDVYETPSAIRRVLPAAGVVPTTVAPASSVTSASSASSASTASTTSLTSAVDLERYALTMMSERVAA